MKTELIGETFCAHAAYRELNIPWLRQIEKLIKHNSRPRFSPSLKGNSERPDFLGRDTSGRWYVFEAKGCDSRPSNNKLKEWKERVNLVKSVEGKPVAGRIVSAAYLNPSKTWEILWKDPPTDGDGLDLQFGDGVFFKLYYEELFAALFGGRFGDLLIVDNGVLAHLPSARLSVGLHRDIVNALVAPALPPDGPRTWPDDIKYLFAKLSTAGNIFSLPDLDQSSINKITTFSQEIFQRGAFDAQDNGGNTVFADGLLIVSDDDQSVGKQRNRTSNRFATHPNGESEDGEVEICNPVGTKRKDMNFPLKSQVYRPAEPGRIGVTTGNTRTQGGLLLVEVAWGVNQKEFVPEQFLRNFDLTAEGDPLAGALDGEFGRAEDLRRVLTFEKLRGSLHDFLYPLFANIGGEKTFLFPSEVRLNNGRLTTPFDADYSGDPINYLKMAVAAVTEPRERQAWLKNLEGTVPAEWRNAMPQHIEALTAYYLGRVLVEAMVFIRSKAPDFGQLAEDRCFVNMAVPVGHAQLRHLEKAFLAVLHHAYVLMDTPILRGITVDELLKQLSSTKPDNAVAQNCYLYPEVSANVQSYIRSPAARSDLHLFVDVGAGTVDLSAFIYFPESSDSRKLNYLAADVLPLGSSQIELRAVSRCNVPLLKIREFKETNHTNHALLPLISAAVRSVMREIENELRPTTAGLLRKVSNLIPTARNKRHRNSQFYRTQLLLGGGGMREIPYKSAVTKAMAEVHIDDPPIIPLPVPRDLVWPDRATIQKDLAYSRLSVAYGLSFLKATLDEHRFPSEILPYPVLPPTSNYTPRQAPTKDEM